MISLNGEVEDVKDEVLKRLGDVLKYFHANEGTVNLDAFITLAFTQSKEVPTFKDKYLLHFNFIF